MPKLFSFSSGANVPRGITQALSDRTAASTRAAELVSSSYQHAASLFVSGVQAARERQARDKLAREQMAQQTALAESEMAHRSALELENQKFTAEQNRLSREQRATEQRENLAAGQQGAFVELLGRFGTSAIGAGVSPGAVTEELLGGAANILGQPMPGAPGGAAGFPPGGPGGDLIGMQEEQYKGLQREQSGFSKWEVPPPPPSEGDKDREWLNEVGEVKRDIELFMTSPEAKKAMLPVKITRLKALGLEQMHPRAAEKEALIQYPEYAIQRAVGIDGEEDRSQLDDLMRWLNEPVEVPVMGGAAVAAIRSSMWAKHRPGVIDQALTERFGGKVATTQAEIDQIARRTLQEEMKAQQDAGRRVSMSVQAPSLGAMLGAAQQQQLVTEATQGAMRPIPYTKASLESLNINTAALPRRVRDAMSIEGYSLVPNDTGYLTVVDQAGREVPDFVQREVDEAFNTPENVELYNLIRVGTALDMRARRTPSEVEDAATLRRMKGEKPGAKAPTEQSGSPADVAIQKAMAALRAQAQRSKNNPVTSDSRIRSEVIRQNRLKSLFGGGR